MGTTLRGLKGIQSTVPLTISGLHVGSHVAVSITPFNGWLRETYAVFAGGEFLDFLAAFALLNDGMAVASIKLTPIFGHKKTIYTFFYACTNHGYHILSL